MTTETAPQTVSIKLPADLLVYLRDTAAREYRSFNQQVVMICQQWREDRLLVGTPAAHEDRNAR